MLHLPPSDSQMGRASRGFRESSPTLEEKIWFVAEDDTLPYYPVYETTPAVAQRLIGQCYGFEYYLAAKDLSWLLCENHHDVVLALGSLREPLHRLNRPE